MADLLRGVQDPSEVRLTLSGGGVEHEASRRPAHRRFSSWRIQTKLAVIVLRHWRRRETTSCPRGLDCAGSVTVHTGHARGKYL